MNEKYINLAIIEAEKAFKENQIPVGAVIVCNDEVISKAHNKRDCTYNILDHAEIISINKAAKKLKNWRLDQCDLYVTLEPCNMCKEIIKESRIKNVYYLMQSNSYNNRIKPDEKVNFKKVSYSQTNKYLDLFYNFFEKIR